MSPQTSSYTPQPEHISPPSSITPTRHALNHDFTSPSAYLNHDAYAPTEPNTPHGSLHITESVYDPASHSLTSLHHAPADDSYDFSYGDFEADYGMEDQGHFLPMTLEQPEDDRTPVVSDSQPHIPASSLPHPPKFHGQETIRASHASKPLMSPFRQFQNQSMMAYPIQQQTFDPTTFYTHPTAAAYTYTNGSPHDQIPTYVPIPQQHQYSTMPQPGFPIPQQAYYAAPQPGYEFTGPPRSRNGSPTSSVASSQPSLARSASTSSELKPPRPKVKLTFEDKRNIVELHRANSSLRQEDIARQYGVDRSTISKIILSAHRWTQPQEIHQPVLPKAAKTVGGRFPAIEAKMDEWLDKQIAAGQDVRDNIARDMAKAFATEIGFPGERFKASAKWWDKFKDRRRIQGKPVTTPLHHSFNPYMYQMGYAHTATMSPIGGSILLSRSHSTLTLSSSDSSGQDGYQPSPQYPALATPNRMGFVQSTPDLTAMEITPNSRQRSQSSPQVAVDPGAQSPSSGKAQRFGRPSPLNLQRQNSYHGTSPSPRRPVSLSRTNSTQSGLRRSRPGSLAASAFGITPIVGEDQVSPLNSPLTSASSSVGTHSRQRSDVSLAPFMTSMSGMTISPDMSDSGEPGSVLPMQMTVPPLTPITPGQGVVNGVFKTTDYGDMATEVPRYATMPNKHYETTHYAHQVYPSSDFGPAYAPQNSAWQ